MTLKEQRIRGDNAIKMETKVNGCECEGKLSEVRKYGDHSITIDRGKSN